MFTVDQPKLPTTWYGPATVEFAYQCPGNPYDSEANDLRVQFKTKSGATVERLAFFDGSGWRAILLADKPGDYSAQLVRNGVPVGAAKKVMISSKLKIPFVRTGRPWGFAYDNGKPYWPLGHNVGWTNKEVPNIPAYLETMGKNGINWSRIWACHWDGKNPWWQVSGPKVEIGSMSQAGWKQWDDIVAASEKSGVYFQFVLFHHGPWSSRVNSNWGENPWNVKNGGFLNTPTEFFTSPRARKLVKDYVRYAIARYSHSPSVLAWELFNEVEWVDPRYENKVNLIGEWHSDLYKFVRSLDAYRHMTTSSSGMELPIYAGGDFYQPHGYPTSVRGAIAGFVPPKDKPTFFGEIGPGELMADKPVQVAAIRDGIYTALTQKHAGAAQFWTWDLVAKYGLEREFAQAAKIIKESGVIGHPDAVTFKPVFDAPATGTLVMKPALGWEPTKKFEFNLPEDGDTGMGSVSGFFQGRAHSPTMRPKPLTFRFKTTKVQTITLQLGTVSRGGANLVATLDGVKVVDKNWAPADRDQQEPTTLTFACPAGAHELVLDNVGADWVKLDRISIPGIGPSLSADALVSKDFALMRIQKSVDAPGEMTTSWVNLPAGFRASAMAVVDLETGLVSKSKVVPGNSVKLTLKSRDSVVYLTK